MNKAVRNILASYLAEGKILPANELSLAGNPLASGKDPVFVTLYAAGRVIASSGRIHSVKGSTVLELIENSLLCLKDPRITQALKTADDLAKISVRVDVLINGGRRVLQKAEDLDISKEWLIFLSQGRNRFSVVLPNIANIAENGADLLKLAKQKAGVEESIDASEYVIYGLRTEVFSDF